MAKRPEDRFPSVRAFAEALQAALERGTAPPIHEATVRAGGFVRVETAEQSGLQPEAELDSAVDRAAMPRPIDTRQADGPARHEADDASTRGEAPLGRRRLAASLVAVGLVGSAGLYAALHVGPPAAPDAGLSVTVLAGGSPVADAGPGARTGRAAAQVVAVDAAAPDAAVPDAAVPDAAAPDAAAPDAAPAAAPADAAVPDARARPVVAAVGRRRRPPGGEPLRPRRVAAAPAAGDCATDFQRIRRASAGASLGPGTPLCNQILALGRRSDAGKCQEPLDGFELMRSLCQ